MARCAASLELRRVCCAPVCEHDASLRRQEDAGNVKDAVTEAYENRIRAFSAPEKVRAVARAQSLARQTHALAVVRWTMLCVQVPRVRPP